MAWRAPRGWHSAADMHSSAESTQPSRSGLPSGNSMGKAHSPPDDPEQAMWSAVRRLGPAYKWLSSDLFLLGAAEHPANRDILDTFAELLAKLGRRVLPDAGAQPMSKLVRARAEVQDLASLLLSLASRTAQVCEDRGHRGDALPSPLPDPLQVHDPWVRRRSTGEHIDADPGEARHSNERTSKDVDSSGISTKASIAVQCEFENYTNLKDSLRLDTIERDIETVRSWDAADILHVGDLIQLHSSVLSLDSHPKLATQLPSGLCGQIVQIDSDGDLLATFPSLRRHGFFWCRRWLPKDTARGGLSVGVRAVDGSSSDSSSSSAASDG